MGNNRKTYKWCNCNRYTMSNALEQANKSFKGKKVKFKVGLFVDEKEIKIEDLCIGDELGVGENFPHFRLKNHI